MKMKIGDIVSYTFGYGKNKTEKVGEFKGYTDKGKAIFGRWEFKDNIVDPKNITGVHVGTSDDGEEIFVSVSEQERYNARVN